MVIVAGSEIRVRVTREDILRAREERDEHGDGDVEAICPVAQALTRLGHLGVEVHPDGAVTIGMDRFQCIDERPGGERLSRFTNDFDCGLLVDTEEFVLRRSTLTSMRGGD